MIEKYPLPIDDIDTRPPDDRSLSEVCRDYTAIESNSQQNETKRLYEKPILQRLRTGRSILAQVENIETTSTGNYHTLKISGRLPYTDQEISFSDPKEVLSSIRQKQSQDTTTGSFMVATPINSDLEYYQIGHNPVVTIEELDLQREKITIQWNALYTPQTDYTNFHKRFTIDNPDSDKEIQITEGDYFILDPSPDDFTSGRTATAMRLGNTNNVTQHFEKLLTDSTDNLVDSFEQSQINEFATWLTQTDSFETPNDEQMGFIKDVSHELSLLQGPPGTGKTSLALAPAIVARLLAHQREKGTRIIVTGPSNKAIDEITDSVATIINAYSQDPQTDSELDDTFLLRAANEPENEENQITGVTYDPLYSGSPAITDMTKRLSTPLPKEENPTHTIVFSTPSRAWKLGKQIITNLDPNSPLSDMNEQTQITGDDVTGLFDVLAIDESSMMELPPALMSGAFYEQGGNILISGDHRQLPPVQRHDWNSEYRPTITSFAPYLSALDFARLARGDKIDSIDQDMFDLLDESLGNTKRNIPLHQLAITYRCHSDLAEFLKETVYRNDGIDYRSQRTETIEASTSPNKGLETATDPDNPITLITYRDPRFQQANELEALLARDIIDNIHEDETTGVVTPHNAQRALLENRVNETIPNRTPDIDTVERFQGGERDVMIVNGTVSDPDYIEAESDFLLNLNRINVSISRMKKKLIIIAAEPIFNHIPLDTQEYERANIWKALAHYSGLDNAEISPDWTGTVTDFTQSQPSMIDTHINPNTEISIYHLTI